MWATLALAAVLQTVPAQDGKLALTNVRTTYGKLGQERKGDKFLPGDRYVVSFDIEGLQPTDTGEVAYIIGMELTNKKGEAQIKGNTPQNLKTFNALGGTRLPAYAETGIGPETPPGEYTLTVTVTDPATKATQKLVRKFEVIAKTKVGIVALYLSDGQLTEVPPLAVPGQVYYVHFMVVGFDLDKKNNPDLAYEVIIRDSEGKPTFKNPLKDTDKTNPLKDTDKADKLTAIPRHYELPINRSGKFTIEIKVTDNITGKTAEETLSLTVLERPK